MGTRTACLPLLIFALFVSFLPTTEAAVPETYTNNNLWHSSHDQPVSFSVAADGSVIGQTETGKTFRQINVANDAGIRLQKFSIDEAWFYVDGHDTFMALTDELAVSEALRRHSARLTLAI